MNIQPKEFIDCILNGETEEDLNKTESGYIDSVELKRLINKYGHTEESAKKHLLTDYSNGYTICKKCGTFYHLGKGFTKHLSNGCLHCEGQEKHNTYWHNGNNERNYKTSPRWMSCYFDNGMHYCKDKAEIEKFKIDIICV